MTGYPQVNFNPYNMYQNWSYGYQYPVFRGVQNLPQPVNIPQPNVNLQTPPDTVSFKATEHIQPKPKKEGLSTGAKWGLGALALAGIGTAVYFATRGKVGAKQAQQLAEHIEFKPAKTVEEALEFGKKNLGLNYKGFSNKDIETLNWVNEGIVNVSNKMKGKTKLPKTISYEYIDDLTLLEVNRGGNLLKINKTVFGDIDATINNYLNSGEYWVSTKGGQLSFPDIYSEHNMEEVLKSIRRFRNNEYSFVEKVELFENLQGINAETNSLLSNPINRLKSFLSNAEIKDRMVKLNLETDINKIMKMSPDEQENLLLSCINKANVKIKYKPTSRFKTIYHEFGHLNDPNISGRACVKAFYDSNKETYPEELTEWFNNTHNLKVSGEVSSYATENPAEFIAETFAGLAEGKAYSDDVMALYKKYGGPALT